jgi:uncharacterized protein (TIGR02145 family)
MKHILKNPATNLILAILLIVVQTIALTACEDKGKKAQAEQAAPEEASEPSDGSAFTDERDGKKYKSVKIGEQVWMAENLNFKTEKSWCYDNDEANCKKYGRLYDFGKAKEVCPSGWHLPSRVEWNTLAEYAGGRNFAGKKLKSTSGWKDNGNGTDDYGFSAMPGGTRNYDDGSFSFIGEEGLWWSSTTHESFSDAYIMSMEHNRDYVTESGGIIRSSVRCVKGEEESSEPSDGSALTDARDGKTYKTVIIGSQTWMVENLNIKMGNFWCYDNKEENCQKYGRLYDWQTAMKACPSGWHLPSDEEWSNLMVAVGGVKVIDDEGGGRELYGIAGRKLKSTSGWKDNGNGTDDFGFAALPGGNGDYGGNFAGSYGYWWSSGEHDNDNAYFRNMGYDGDIVYRDAIGKDYLLSVRCVKD